MPDQGDVIELIDALPGVDKDNSPLSTQHYTASSNIRFYNGKPQKLGGNTIFNTDGTVTITGCARTLYSQLISSKMQTLIGTHTRLYSLFSTALTNITLLLTATTAIANSLDSNFQTLGNDPITTVSSSNTLTISSTAHVLVAGDIIILSGATGFNGIPAGEINATHIVRSTTTNDYTIIVATSASSSGSGGGAAVVEATAVVTVNQTAHNFTNGDRVKILAATTFAGIPASEINVEHIIRNVQTNTYDIAVTTQATSSVSGGSGASTTVQGQIAAGDCDASLGIGYGMGKYGVGRYGVSKTSTSLRTTPRIYSADRFGNNVVLTPGDQSKLYIWAGDTTIAPTVVANAPTTINYVFVSNNIIVTFGAAGVPNRLKWSDVGDATDWTPTEVNQARERDIETAGELITHAEISTVNLLFTADKVFAMRYINLPLIWDIKDIGAVDGIIARNARVVYNNVCFWMGNQDFYMYNGGVIQPIPSNSQNRVNYVKKFVFDNINQSQQTKCFAWFNEKFNEIWFHYPDGTNLECNKVAKFNVEELHWSIDDVDRTAGEYPLHASINPLMVDTANNIRKHEIGVDDDTSILTFSLTSPSYQTGSSYVMITGIIPDSIQTGNASVLSRTRRYVQDSVGELSRTSTFTSTTTEITYQAITGRNWQYVWTGNELGNNWRMGDWYQIIKGSTPD